MTSHKADNTFVSECNVIKPRDILCDVCLPKRCSQTRRVIYWLIIFNFFSFFVAAKDSLSYPFYASQKAHKLRHS